jgi:hypothetical protein
MLIRLFLLVLQFLCTLKLLYNFIRVSNFLGLLEPHALDVA